MTIFGRQLHRPITFAKRLISLHTTQKEKNLKKNAYLTELLTQYQKRKS